MSTDTMITNPAARAHSMAMNRYLEAQRKTASAETAKPISKGLMGMARRQPEEQKKTQEPLDRAQEMFNQMRDQRRSLQNGGT